MNAIGQFFVKVWDVLKATPILGPVLRLLYSRKALIAAAMTGVIVRYVPALAEIEPEVDVVVLQIVSLVVVWMATSLGYALEDYAEKSQGSAGSGSVGSVSAGEIGEVNVSQPQPAPIAPQPEAAG